MMTFPTGLEVSVQPSKVTAGEEIVCLVDIGEGDSRIRDGRVELGYNNTYEHLGHGTSAGDSVRTTTRWVPVRTLQLFAGTPMGGRQIVRIRIPEDAPPTTAGVVEWQLRAIVDRRRGFDARVEAPLVVLANPEAMQDRTRTPATSSTRIMPITFTLSTRQLSPGGTLTGAVTATPIVPGHTRGLHIQLVHERYEGHSLVDRGIHAMVALIGPCELRPGEPIGAPFQIELAADASPCFQAEHNSRHWYLEAIVDLPMVKDEISRIELLVI